MTSSRAPSDASRSLRWTRSIECRWSGSARWQRRLDPRRREYVDTGLVAFDHAMDAGRRERAQRLLVHRWTGASLLEATEQQRLRSRARADLVLLGARRSASQFRFRAFYLDGSGGGTSLAVQQRRQPGGETPLLRGSRLLGSVQGKLPFVVPELHATGTVLAGPGEDEVGDWALEGLVEGDVVPVADTDAVVDEVLELLGDTWVRLGTRHVPLRSRLQTAAWTGLTDLVGRPPAGAWPEEVHRDRLLRRARDVLGDPRPLTVGLSHGDPGVGNLLRTVDGRLALLDWEFADHRHVAHDVAKVLRSSLDPVAACGRLGAPPALRARMAVAGALPWDAQVGVALLVFLSYWRDRHQRAAARGLAGRSSDGLATMVRMLDVLLPS